MQLRQAEARNERKAYEKHLRQDEKQRAAAPPSYDKAMSHEVVDDTVPLVWSGARHGLLSTEHVTQWKL